ncbi:MAG TPA: hypothetical protein VIJ68_00060 [Candidatus Saccharimonadales bacterium]
MAASLPDVFHTPPGAEVSRYDVIIRDDGYWGTEGPVPVSYLQESGSVGQSQEVAWRDITPLGYGEIIRAYRALRAAGEIPTEEAISQTLYGDEGLSQRLSRLQEQESTFEPPERWFDGRNNNCGVTLKTPDSAEHVFFYDFASMLFKSRVGIGISSTNYSGVHQERIEFTAQSDWQSKGAGTAALPIIKTYFPEVEVEFEPGSKRIPLLGHPEATPSDGFGNPRHRVISSADLPSPTEDSRAWANTLTAQVRHFFQGPPYPEIATDPEFEPLLTDIREGLADFHRRRDEGAFSAQGEVRAALNVWQREIGQRMAGKRVVIYPRAEVPYRYSLDPSGRSDWSGSAGPYTRFEGYIAQTSISGQGEIVLVGGVRSEAEPDYIPEHSEFKSLWLSDIFGVSEEQEEALEGRSSWKIEPRIAISGPSERELLRPDDLDDLLERYRQY